MSKSKCKGIELLRSEYFFSELLSTVRECGLVGEERTAQVVYLVGVSRLLDKPLCLFIKGPSGVGKNFLADTVLSLFPLSEVQPLTSSSTRSWNYLGRKLAHKIVYVKERNDSSGSVHPTRLLISEKKLVHWVTVRQGGQFVQRCRVTEGPIASISTTTKDRVEVDDETRHVSIWLDETPEQTRRIMEAAFDKEARLTAREKRVWHDVQRLLEKRARFPIEFPDWFKNVVEYVRSDNLWARRYFPAFLQACRAVALIRSFRRDAQEIKRQKKITVWFTDFAVTALIFNDVFAHSLNTADEQDLEVQQHVRQISSRKSGTGARASELAAEMGITSDRAYMLLSKAMSAGTVFRSNQPSKTNLKLYLPSKRRPFLPEPAEVFHKLQELPQQVEFVHPLTGEPVFYKHQTER